MSNPHLSFVSRQLHPTWSNGATNQAPSCSDGAWDTHLLADTERRFVEEIVPWRFLVPGLAAPGQRLSIESGGLIRTSDAELMESKAHVELRDVMTLALLDRLRVAA